MADKAFDAFSQRRNTGTQDRLTERRRVDTYTDPNRYQMPPRRRLGVHAQNKSLFEAPGKSNITAFAEGLAKVQPQIMDYLAKEEIEANKIEVQHGIKDAMATEAMKAGDTEYVDNEWRQFAFEQKKAMMAGEELTTQLLVDVENKDPMVDFQPWYEDWYAQKMEEFPHLATMDPEVMESFNKPVQKGLTTARNHALVTKDNLQQKRYKATATDHIERTLEEAIKYGHEVNNELIERIIADEENMSRWGMTENNKIIFDAVSRIAKGTLGNRNIDALKYLDEGRGEGGNLPSISTMRHDEVEALRKEVVGLINADEIEDNKKLSDQDAIVLDNAKTAQKRFDFIIGSEDDIVPGGIRTADKVRGWKTDYMNEYREKVNARIAAGEDRYVAHDTVLAELEAHAKLWNKEDPAYKELREEKAKRAASSDAYTAELTRQPNFEESAAELYAGMTSGQPFDPASVIPAWNKLDENGKPFLTDESKNLILKAGMNAAADKEVKNIRTIVDDKIAIADQHKLNEELTVRERTAKNNKEIAIEVERGNKELEAANKVQSDTDTRDAEQREKEQQSMHQTLKRQKERIEKQNEAKKQIEIEKAEAWHRDVDLSKKLEEEFDIPQEQRVSEEGYKKDATDNQGIYTDPDFNYVDPGTFGESIFGQIWDGVLDVGEAIYDIYDYKGPDTIEVDPMQEDKFKGDRDQYNRKDNNPFYGKPLMGDESRPSVNTNPNLETKPNDFQEQMKTSESSGNYEVVNDEGFMGAYQFGDDRLDDFKQANNLNFTQDEFLNNPELQDKVFNWHVKDYKKRIKKAGLDSYIGKTINGVEVTEDGLVAVAHLGGFGGMRQFLKTNGKDDEADSNGTSMTDYLRKFKA